MMRMTSPRPTHPKASIRGFMRAALGLEMPKVMTMKTTKTTKGQLRAV